MKKNCSIIGLVALLSITTHAYSIKKKTPIALSCNNKILFQAASKNDIEWIKYALSLPKKNKININSQDKHGATPTMWASYKGNEGAAKLFIAHGAKLDMKDKMGITALIYAIDQNNESMVKLLLVDGHADPNVKDKNGMTALMWAIDQNNESMVKLLLVDGRTNQNVKDKNGMTALMWAIDQGNIHIVKLLLGYGAKLSIKDNNEMTPLMRAQEKNNEEIIRLLIIPSKRFPSVQENQKKYQKQQKLYHPKSSNYKVTPIVKTRNLKNI